MNLKLLIVLSRLKKSVDRALTPAILETGLTPTQFGVLEALYHKGPLTINEIIGKILSSSGNVGVVIKNLEDADLIQKEISSSDKRSKTVSISSRGKAIISEFFPKHVDNINHFFNGLNLKEKKDLISSLKKMSSYIGENL